MRDLSRAQLNRPVAGEPTIKILSDKRIIGDFRMITANARDLVRLTRAQTFARVEAPGALKQALPAQNFVTPGDAAAKAVRDIEDRPVGIGQFPVEREQLFYQFRRRHESARAVPPRTASTPPIGRANRRETAP